MQAISNFSLAKHQGDYQSWPLSSELLLDGEATGLKLPGYALLHQYKSAAGEYFFVTDWDCPYEELTHFMLVSKDYKVLSSRKFGRNYCPYFLCEFRQMDETNFLARFNGDIELQIKIRDWGIPYLMPRIKLKHLPG